MCPSKGKGSVHIPSIAFTILTADTSFSAQKSACNLLQNPIPISSSQFELLFSFQYHVNTFTSCHFTTAISLRHYKLKNAVYTIKWSFKRLCKAPRTHLNSDSLYYPSQRQNLPPFPCLLLSYIGCLKF